MAIERNGGYDALKDPEVQGSELDYKFNMFRHMDRLSKIACGINPESKGDIRQFESGLNILKSFIRPYLTFEFIEQEKEFRTRRSKLLINRVVAHRYDYYNLLLEELAAITAVMDRRGMLLRTFENEDIDVVNQKNR